MPNSPIGQNANPRGKQECSLFTERGEELRLKMLAKNVYNSNSNYTIKHPNATQAKGGNDDPANKKGKATGNMMDTNEGGSTVDINGNPENGGLGRNQSLAMNRYNPNNTYDAKQCLI